MGMSHWRDEADVATPFAGRLSRFVTNDLNWVGSTLFDVSRGISYNLWCEFAQKDMYPKLRRFTLFRKCDRCLVAL